MNKTLTAILLLAAAAAGAAPPFDTNNLVTPLVDGTNGYLAWPTNIGANSFKATNYNGGGWHVAMGGAQPLYLSNETTGATASFQLDTNGYVTAVDKYGTVVSTGTNGVFAVRQTNGSAFGFTNGSLTLSGTLTAAALGGAGTNMLVNYELVADYLAGSNALRTDYISRVSSASNSVYTNAVGLTNDLTVLGVKAFVNPAGTWFGVVSNATSISGTVVVLSNGVYLSPALSAPKLTNGVNYGTAFSSPGTGSQSEHFGYLAASTGASSLGVGSIAQALGDSSTAVGEESTANNDNDTAVGAFTTATGGFSSAFGASANAAFYGSTALGTATYCGFTNSTAVGNGAQPTAADQVMLGSSGSSTVVPNSLTVGTNATIGRNLTVGGNATISGNVAFLGVQTNGTHFGTNNFLADSDVAFARYAISSLANGDNAAVPIRTNVFGEISGPTGAFAICGVANGRDGKLITLINQTGQQMTVKNESGGEPTAANRIRVLGSAADLVLTNAAVTLIYNANVSRWIVTSHNP